MFMYNNEVCYIIRSTRICKFFDDVVSSIYSVRVWEDETHLLAIRCVNDSFEKQALASHTFAN